MLAAALEGVEKLVVKEVPPSCPLAHGVLVRVQACGICLIDYEAYSREKPMSNFLLFRDMDSQKEKRQERKSTPFPGACGKRSDRPALIIAHPFPLEKIEEAIEVMEEKES